MAQQLAHQRLEAMLAANFDPVITFIQALYVLARACQAGSLSQVFVHVPVELAEEGSGRIQAYQHDVSWRCGLCTGWLWRCCAPIRHGPLPA